MRQLHPVSVREAFVASGVYTAYENGQPSGVVEHWSIHQLPDNSEIVRVDYDARRSSGISILLEALRDPNDRIERFDITYYRDHENPVKRAKATYTFFDGYVEIGRTLDGEERMDERLDLPQDTVIYPLMHVFTGIVIKRVVVHGGAKVPLFHPDVVSSNPGLLLRGTVIAGVAAFVGHETLDVSGKQVATSIYEFSADIYSGEGCFWLNERDFLVQRVYKHDAQKQSLVVLTQYAHRP